MRKDAVGEDVDVGLEQLFITALLLGRALKRSPERSDPLRSETIEGKSTHSLGPFAKRPWAAPRTEEAR